MPPTTTTTKASPITVRSIARLAGSRANCSAPPRPASPEPQANTSVKSMAWLTPSAPTISRSCVAARISRPKRVLVSSEVQADQHDRPDDDQEQVVAREAAIENLDRPAQARRARPEQVFVAPDPERRVVDDQQHREGGEQLEQLRRLVDAPQQQDLDQRADRRDHAAAASTMAPQKPSPPPTLVAML